MNLTIAGKSYAATPGRDTQVSLPGLGTVVLNQEKSHVDTTSGSTTVNALVLNVTAANTFGLPLGLRVVLGHAQAGLTGPTTDVLGGSAFGTKLTALGVATSGPSALAVVPCLGTDGTTVTNSTVAVTIPLVDTGVITSTAQGDITATDAEASTTDTIANVSLLPGALGGLLSAQAVTASASATRSGGVTALSDSGIQVVGLSVAGFPLLGDDIPANTVLAVGVGTLYLHRVIQTGDTITVRDDPARAQHPARRLPLGYRHSRIASQGPSGLTRGESRSVTEVRRVDRD